MSRQDSQDGVAPQDLKMANLGELHDLGILQEANRLFFHPLGLALTFNMMEDGTVEFFGIQDARDDPEGCVFGDLSTEDAKNKHKSVENLRNRFRPARQKLFSGLTIQPIGHILSEDKG